MAKKKNDPEDESSAATDEGETSKSKKKKDKKGKKEEPAGLVMVTNDQPGSVDGDTSAEEIKHKQPKTAILSTREIGKRYLDREKYLKLCLREMLIYLVFLIVLGLLAAGHRGGSEYYLSRVMTKLFVEGKFTTKSTGEIINYNEINTLEQVWEYFDYYIINLYWSFYYSHTERVAPVGEDNLILYENKLVGCPRIRQLRVKNNSCTVPDDFKQMFASCYAEYSGSTEDKAPFGPGNFTQPSAWKFSEPSALKASPLSGEISTYGGGGFYWDLSLTDQSKSNDTKYDLFDKLWLDRGSRALVMQFTTYNGNENLFFTLQLLLELPPTGGVLPSYVIHIQKFLMRDLWDMILLVLTGIFVLYILYFTVEEAVEINYFRWHYLNSFWNLMDLWILILCYITLGWFIISFMAVKSEIVGLVTTIDKHACFDSINNIRDTYLTLLAVLFFFAAIKILKYMNFNHSMYQMQTTLSRATKDISCFSIIFFIVFVTFAQLGHLLFGSQVRDFRSFIHSVFALLRTAVGDFDYHKIENVNHFLGPVYFFAYIFFIYFILVNMFLAIIIDTYSEVRASIRDQSRELQLCDLFARWGRNLMKCCGCKKLAAKYEKPLSAPDDVSAHQDIQNLLRRCGFTEMEIDLFFAKFDIPRDKQISQEEMRSKLLTNFNMQPEAGKVPPQEGQEERDEIGEKLMARIRVLEDNITDVNYKIDLIDNKIDAIQQIRARRKTQAPQQE